MVISKSRALPWLLLPLVAIAGWWYGKLQSFQSCNAQMLRGDIAEALAYIHYNRLLGAVVSDNKADLTRSLECGLSVKLLTVRAMEAGRATEIAEAIVSPALPLRAMGPVTPLAVTASDVHRRAKAVGVTEDSCPRR